MRTIIKRSNRWHKLLLIGVLFGLLSATHVGSALAWMDIDPATDPNPDFDPTGIRILKGEYVMNVGEVQINITNWGLIGSAFSTASTYGIAPSCQWPAGSGNEYLWASGLWVGGIVLGEQLVTTGGRTSEWGPLDEIEETIYEAIDTKLVRPPNELASGRRAPMPDSDDDGDGEIDEEILNGHDDDEDGLIDEDFAQIGNQMFVLTNYDNTRRGMEMNPNHKPMNLQVVQSTYQWENDQVDDFVGFEYQITNIGVTDIEGVYIGFFSDSDIMPRSGGDAGDDKAGMYSGIVRASDGTFQFVEVGYMFDDAESNPLPGYFGIIFLGHDVDPSGMRAPTRVGLRTFQAYAGSQPYESGGDPLNDAERYESMSNEENDGVSPRPDDFRFLVSAGPFEILEPDQTLNFQVGMVVGPGLGDAYGGRGLLANCAEALLTWNGIWVDDITSVGEGADAHNPGQYGRETMLCRDDFGSGSTNPWDEFHPDFMDTSCLSPQWVINTPVVAEEDKFSYTNEDGETKLCAMFNMDHCLECVRQLGRICTEVDFDSEQGGQWDCNDQDPIVTHKPGCTGLDGEDTQIHWLVGMAPPPPGMRLWASDSRVHVFWDDRSENTEDIRLKKIDFESYRVWRADNWDRPFGSSIENGPENGLWQLINEFDLVNFYVSSRVVDGVTYLDTIPLGANTGLDGVKYTPVVLSDPAYDGLAEDTQEVVDADVSGIEKTRPDLRDSDGELISDYEPLWRWEAYPDVMDTFWAVAYREPTEDGSVVEKRSIQYYEYLDSGIHNGFVYFYSVTATDHELEPGDDPDILLPLGPGLNGNPGSSFMPTTPGTDAQTIEQRERDGVNIYVFPNPATRDALEEYQQMSPNGDDPTGVRVTFCNLPMAKNTVSIFTVSGDLVQTISHDGTDGSGHTSWNLMSRNGQEVVSGIYLYSVQADNDGFDDFVGKFVVVR